MQQLVLVFAAPYNGQLFTERAYTELKQNMTPFNTKYHQAELVPYNITRFLSEEERQGYWDLDENLDLVFINTLQEGVM